MAAKGSDAKPPSSWQRLRSKLGPERIAKPCVCASTLQANPRQQTRKPEFYIVPSTVIAKRMRATPRPTGATFYSIQLANIKSYQYQWSVFGK
jgi:hypothetical protein